MADLDTRLPKVAVATHAFESVDFDIYYNHIFAFMHWVQKYELFYIGRRGLAAACARNMLVDMAIKEGCEYIFFLDADHLITKNTLPLLMENRQDAIISGLTCKRMYPYTQVVWLKDGKGLFIEKTLPLDGKIYEVGVCSFGCTLINLSKLKKLKKPYFRDTCKPGADGSLNNIRSDINICDMFREAGESVFVDTRVLVGHRGEARRIFPQNAGLYKNMHPVECELMKLREGMSGDYPKNSELP